MPNQPIGQHFILTMTKVWKICLLRGRPEQAYKSCVGSVLKSRGLTNFTKGIMRQNKKGIAFAIPSL
jgi:hypothetical protein